LLKILLILILAVSAASATENDETRALLTQAVAQTTRAIEINPGKAEAYAARAAAYDQLGETKLMLIDLRAAAARNPAYREPLNKIEAALGLPNDAAVNSPPKDLLIKIGILLVAVAVGGGALAALVGRFRKTA